MKLTPRSAGVGVVLVCAIHAWAAPGLESQPVAREPAPAAAPATGAVHAALKAGDVLDQNNWEQAKELLPPEILRHYREGEYLSRVIDWPLGIYNWDPEFSAATEGNSERYTVSPEGTILEKSTGTQPPLIFGFPFPRIDSKDPNAGVKILWNFNYGYWNEGSSHNLTVLNWISPGHLDRQSIQDVSFLLYDGQNPPYRIPNPNNLSEQFISIANSPADLNGTASLTWRYRDTAKRDLNWVYVPALRRVRAVSPANRSDGFLGSDMSQDDGPFFDGKPEDFAWTLVGEGETLRFVDPASFDSHPTQVWLRAGGWRAIWPSTPIAGYQDPKWKGLAWAPVRAALARRPVWIIAGVPKDKYYLFGRIELYIDKETYQGAWNRKFGWGGELLNTLQVLAYQKQKLTRPDGQPEWLWASTQSYQCAENLKMNRATLAGLQAPGKDVANDRRVHFDPNFFDSTTLQRFGK